MGCFEPTKNSHCVIDFEPVTPCMLARDSSTSAQLDAIQL